MGIVTFKPQGRLGNWFFCAFTTIAYAKKHGIKFSPPIETNDHYHNPIYYTELNCDHSSLMTFKVKEIEYFKFDEIVFHEEWRDSRILLQGFFQNPKYFQDYRKEILEIFEWNDKTYEEGVVSIHRRLGDYLTIPNKHVVPSIEWYEKAMLMFPGYKFVFYSDDIEQCKRDFGYDRPNIYYSTCKNELDDFLSMRRAEHFINSSSTFSWCAAWTAINPNKKVITPSRWMKPATTNQWTEQIVPKEWIRLE